MMLIGGWSESTWRIRSQRSSSSTSKLETPMWRALPSSTSSAMVAHESSTAVPVMSSGQWNWYRSTVSTPSRFRLCSSSNRIDEGRRSFCGTPSSRPYQFCPHLVNTITDRVDSRRTCPTTSSEWPSPYAAAVSTHVMPESKAWCRAAIDSWSSWLPQPNFHGPPIAQAPTPTTEISGPSRPSLRSCILFSLITSERIPYPARLVVRVLRFIGFCARRQTGTGG
jgi:hypothetical protein